MDSIGASVAAVDLGEVSVEGSSFFGYSRVREYFASQAFEIFNGKKGALPERNA